MAIDPASVRLNVISGEAVEEGHTVIIHEVCAHAVMSIHHRDYGFFQLQNDIQAANIQTAGENSIRRPPERSFNATGPADLAAYRRTLDAFNTFVCGISGVCLFD